MESERNLTELLMAVTKEQNLLNNDAAPVETVEDQALRRLADLLQNPSRVPLTGQEASENMRRGFQRVSEVIEQIAKEQVERAQLALQEAFTFSTIVRQAGDELCRRIEQDTARASQISEIMALTRVLAGIREPIKPTAPDPAKDPADNQGSSVARLPEVSATS